MKLVIGFKAEFDGCFGLEVPSGVYALTLKCQNCGEMDEVYVDIANEVDVPGSRGTACMVKKCSMCERRGHLAPIPLPKKSVNPDFHELIAFECRQLEIHDVRPSETQFITHPCIEGEMDAETSFPVLFEDEAWYDYDEEHDMPLQIEEIQFSVDRF